MVEVGGFSVITLLQILVLAWTFGLAAQLLGYPALMDEFVAGIVFGPAIPGVLQPAEALEVFTEFGVFLLMVYVGLSPTMKWGVEWLERAGDLVSLDEAVEIWGPTAALVATVEIRPQRPNRSTPPGSAVALDVGNAGSTAGTATLQAVRPGAGPGRASAARLSCGTYRRTGRTRGPSRRTSQVELGV